MTPDPTPLVTVGVPVYNSARYLEASLANVLAQDYERLEVILCDNASTDDTAAVCREFEARDPRVRYVRRRANLGSRRNFNHVFELASGEYFMWSRGHDLLAPDFVSKAVEILDTEDEVVLCHARVTEIDTEGDPTRSILERIDTRGMPVDQRVRAVWHEVIGPATCGLIRTSAMDRTELYRELAGCDIVFLLELAVHGTFAYIDEPLVRIRLVRSEASEDDSVLRTYRQMNPFWEDRRRPFDAHILEFCQEHLRVIEELHVDAATRLELERDFVDVFRKRYEGSILRAAESIAERAIQHVESGAEPSYEAWRALWYLDVIAMFFPDNEDMVRARELLSGVSAPV